jgi:hypothetical protein
LAIKIDKEALEQACKEIIETILFCLPTAYKGTVYQIGGPPEMITRRITSGVIDGDGKTITWGLPDRSEYNPPGKPWIEYRDEPGRPLEAMGWCVETQKSWTMKNPKEDERNVRLQGEDMLKGSRHMEPVLVRKEDLYIGSKPGSEYPENYEGKVLWQGSEYVVIGVINIHFTENTIEIGSLETKIIKKLSRSLGTELLSYQLRQQSLEAMHRLAEDKINSCKILSDSLRNAITKSGLIFSLIKLELGSLREQWETILLQGSDQKEMKSEAVHALDKVLKSINETSEGLGKELIDAQNKFLRLFLPPERGEKWVRMQIEERWNKLLCNMSVDETQTKEIRQRINDLKRSLNLGKDQNILDTFNEIPEPLKKEWIGLIYSNIDYVDFQFLENLIRILENPSLNLPHQERSRKYFIRLKALAEIMGQLEEDTNVVLREVLNGNEDGMVTSILNKNERLFSSRRL